MSERLVCVSWFETYGCGCVSGDAKRKRDLLGYCATHGDERRHVHPIVKWVPESLVVVPPQEQEHSNRGTTGAHQE